jgi:glycosyltransferase involved in cell wall biosynthesis
MARILLLGEGPLPSTDPERLGFPQLRFEQFAEVLREAGHEVHPADVAELSLEQVRGLRARVQPQLSVSAGPFEPARVAALVAGDEPLFVDVPGDPFAEAQAKSDLPGEGDHAGPMRQAWLPALCRADAFGVISASQRLALLGQLGLLGRLTRAPSSTRWVEVLPAGFGFGSLPERRPRPRPPGAPMTVALCGGFNTWLDVDTLLAGLLGAMDASPDLRVLCTGGGIAGHHEAGFERFRAAVQASDHAHRFRLEGWVAHDRLPRLLASADLGLTLDREGLEAELGTRTRVLFYAHQGLQVASTPRGDLCRELAERGLTTALTVGDPGALAQALLEAQARGSDGNTRLQDHLRETARPTVALAGLVRWAEGPERRPEALDDRAALMKEASELRAQLKALHDSPTWKASSKLRSWLKRE